MVVVTVYAKSNCAACEDALTMLEELSEIVPHRLVKISVDDDPDLKAMYGENVPVIHAGPYRLKHSLPNKTLRLCCDPRRTG